MSQRTETHDRRTTSGDEEIDELRQRQPAGRPGVRPHQPVARPAGDGDAGPDEPEDSEFELAGDNDLGATDLGPAVPGFVDPDTASGRIRKIARPSA